MSKNMKKLFKAILIFVVLFGLVIPQSLFFQKTSGRILAKVVEPESELLQGLFLGEAMNSGIAEGIGRYFEVKDGEYLDISLESSEEIRVILESVPKVINLDIESVNESVNSTELVIKGLEANKTYYKYQDGFVDEIVFVSDENGAYTWEQDLFENHHIWIQETKGTIVITEDTILDSDITGSVQIGADNITLDCSGYKITGSSGSYGIYSNNRENVVVKNCIVSKFITGIYFYETNNSQILNNNSNSHTGGQGIRIDRSSDNTINGNDCFSNADTGILLWSNSVNNSVFNNNCWGNKKGINLWRSSDNNLSSNNISDNNYGIRLFDSSDSVIENNDIISADASEGLMTSVSSNIEIRDNRFTNNSIFLGSDVSCANISYYNTHTIENNTINEKPIYYYKNQSGIKVPEDAGSALLANCDNMSIENINSGAGSVVIELAYTDNSYILNNKVSDSIRGIYLHQSSYNNILENNVSDSIVGVYLYNSYNNKIYHNNFIDNIYQAMVSQGSNNLFDNSYPSRGNYWSDYTGIDSDNDGIGDSPYIFNGGQDNYPFMIKDSWSPDIETIINDLNELREETKASIDEVVDLLIDIDENNNIMGVPEVMEAIYENPNYGRLKFAVSLSRVIFGSVSGVNSSIIEGIGNDIGLTIQETRYLETAYTFLTRSSLIISGTKMAESLYDLYTGQEDIFNSGNKSLISVALKNYLENDFEGFLDSDKNPIFEKGVNALKQSIDNEFNAYITLLNNELPENYPVDIVHRRLQQLKKEIIKSRQGENLLLPINNNILPSIFILGDSLDFSKEIKRDLNIYLGADKVHEFSYWSGATLFFTKGFVFLMGVGAFLQVPLTIGYFAGDFLSAITNPVTWLSGKAIGKNIGLYLTSGINEMAELRAVSVDTLRYLEELEINDWEETDIDNTQIQIDSFEMEDTEIPIGDEVVEINGNITISNNGLDSVPVLTYLEIYETMNVNGEIADIPVMVSRSDWYNLTGNSSVTLDIKPIILMGADKLSMDYYNAKAYIIAGPSIIGRKSNFVIDNFKVDSSIVPYRGRSIENIIKDFLDAGETWKKTMPFDADAVYHDIALWFGGSDLDIHIYDALGRHVGLNYETGEVEVEIPEAVYTGSKNNPEIIRILNNPGELYTIRVNAIKTNSSEPFEVNISHIPEREPILTVAPSTLYVKVNLEEESEIDFIVSAKEIGGQKDCTGLTVETNDLVSGLSSIPSSVINIDLPSANILAGSSIDIPIMIDIPYYVLPGIYQGEIIFETDNDNIILNAVIEVERISPRGLKNSVIQELEGFETESKKIKKEIEKIIKYLDDSLRDLFWQDDFYLNFKHGKKVFSEEIKAVKGLLRLTKRGEETEKFEELITNLVEVDKLLAEIIFEEAKEVVIQNSENNHKLDKYIIYAERELNRAENEDKPDKKIKHYQKAWEYSQKAIKFANRGE